MIKLSALLFQEGVCVCLEIERDIRLAKQLFTPAT